MGIIDKLFGKKAAKKDEHAGHGPGEHHGHDGHDRGHGHAGHGHGKPGKGPGKK